MPTTTSGGLKLAWVSQLTVATVCLSPARAEHEESVGDHQERFLFCILVHRFSPGVFSSLARWRVRAGWPCDGRTML